MVDRTLSRRTLLTHGLPLLTGGMALMPLIARAAGQAPCHDPAASDQGLRQSLNYVETSPDASKTCGDCGFFSGDRNSCGDCQIFHGPANGKGHCDSWSAKA
jgi:hypothetical protein